MLAITRHDAVSLLTLQRPDRRNALNLDLATALWEAARTEVENDARVLIITGEGTAFCSGADLSGVYGEEFIAALYSLLHGLTRLPVPVIAAVNGPAIGAGTQLALASDLRVADQTAVFGVPTARNGMATDAWTMRALQTIAGGGLARRLLIAAETVDQDTALHHGLADRAGDLDHALAWATQIAALAPLTLAHNKLVLNGGNDEEIEATFAACWNSDDVREAAAARAEGRAPVFGGR